MVYVEPLREMLDHLPVILKMYCEENGSKAACQAFDFIPREILSSFGVEVVTLPTGSTRRCMSPAEENFPHDLFSFFIYPEKAPKPKVSDSAVRPLAFEGFTGHGEDAAVALHGSLDGLIGDMTGKSIREIDTSLLSRRAEEHNTMRRLVRGIAAARRSAPESISCRDMMTVFESAMAFPPELVNEHLERLLAYLREAPGDRNTGRLEALLYGGALGDPDTIESIEAAGVTVAEDDHCNGRRQFDLSVNPASEYLFYELLDALTYRPLCPVLREPEERYELLYKLLRNHDIAMVIFLKDTCCPSRLREMEFLRVRLMRDGIDPLVTTAEGAAGDVREYLKKASL